MSQQWKNAGISTNRTSWIQVFVYTVSLWKLLSFNSFLTKVNVGTAFEKHDRASRSPKGAKAFPSNQNLIELSSLCNENKKEYPIEWIQLSNIYNEVH